MNFKPTIEHKDDTFEQKVTRRLANIENHLVNFLLNFQTSQEFERLLGMVHDVKTISKTPFKLETSKFDEKADKLLDTISNMNSSIEDSKISDLTSVINSLSLEIKNINDRIDKMEEFGVKKVISLQVDLSSGNTEVKLPKWTNVKLSTLNLSYRTMNSLKALGIDMDTLIIDLARKPEFEVYRLKGMGKKSLEEVQNALEEYGLTLGVQ